MSIVEKAIQKLRTRELKEDAEPSELPAHRVAARAGAERLSSARVEEVREASVHKKIQFDRDSLAATSVAIPKNQEKLLADEYRQIKRPLIANAIGRGAQPVLDGRLIMVASSLPGEGKSFTSIHLSLSMALEKDISVLLVDADLAKRDVSHIFGVKNEPGLLDALADDGLNVESLIIDTAIPGFSILPAGRHVSEHATELLSGTRMNEVIARLSSSHSNRICVFDSPPLLLTSESRALAAMLGQVVLVVRAGVTPQRNVLDAISYLGEDKAVGVVLNQSEDRTMGGYYGYGAYGDLSATSTPTK